MPPAKKSNKERFEGINTISVVRAEVIEPCLEPSFPKFPKGKPTKYISDFGLTLSPQGYFQTKTETGTKQLHRFAMEQHLKGETIRGNDGLSYMSQQQVLFDKAFNY